MIAGSFASNLHGMPRATNDADIIVVLTHEHIDCLRKKLEGNFYFDSESAVAALNEQLMFNVVHFETGFKIDLIIRKSRPFSHEEFRRRIRAPFHEIEPWFTSVEDTILTKLEWSKLGDSERQFLDAVYVARVAKKLDFSYLQRWASELQIVEQLDRLLKEIAE